MFLPFEVNFLLVFRCVPHPVRKVFYEVLLKISHVFFT